jgi:hypothetical protein
VTAPSTTAGQVRQVPAARAGAVTGTLQHTNRLVPGLHDADGHLVIAGGTGPLTATQQSEIVPLLVAATEDEHPWPAELPSGRLVVFGAKRRMPVQLVRPTLVVEISADGAFEYGRWRHLTRYVRSRPDLDPADVARPR